MTRSVTPGELRAMLLDGGELALIDVREELPFSEAHLLHARSLPLSRLELRLDALVPRRATRVVLCDGGEGLAARAAALCDRFGYGDVAVLAGGAAAWEKAGYLLFSGTNVPSKAFGEFLDPGTPSISAEELHALIDARANLVVLDSRPFDEYRRVSIPAGIDVPGAELVLRVKDMAPDPQTLVVVNCAGRTRSILGARSLLEAGVPNRVVALRNGTMGWALAGYSPAHGQERRAPAPSAGALAWAQRAARTVAARAGVSLIDRATLARFQADAARSTYLFDVRDPAEYAAGHLAGARAAPGGQLVQATDQYVGTLGARLVLSDPLEVRALMTASWLRRMGWESHALAAEGDETQSGARVLGLEDAPDAPIMSDALAALLDAGTATVVDLASSRAFREGHVAGAWFAIRTRLAQALPRIPARGTLVVTSEDGVLARLALAEAMALWHGPVRALAGGTAAWPRPLEAGGDRMADEPLDLWLKAYERASGVKDAMEEYLRWETDLLHRVAADGTCRFT